MNANYTALRIKIGGEKVLKSVNFCTDNKMFLQILMLTLQNKCHATYLFLFFNFLCFTKMFLSLKWGHASFWLHYILLTCSIRNAFWTQSWSWEKICTGWAIRELGLKVENLLSIWKDSRLISRETWFKVSSVLCPHQVVYTTSKLFRKMKF